MNNNPDVNSTEPVVEPTNAGTQEPVKTYTKEDLDNSFNAGVRKASTDWQKDEKYKEFLEWKKTNQNDSEKIAELETSKASLSNELNQLKAQIKVNESDVKKEFSKFVTSEVLSLVNDTTDFETALKDYKKNNPQYFGEVIVKKVQTSPNLNGGASQPLTTNQIMNDILRNKR
jgi:hypothetical protein